MSLHSSSETNATVPVIIEIVKPAERTEFSRLNPLFRENIFKSISRSAEKGIFASSRLDTHGRKSVWPTLKIIRFPVSGSTPSQRGREDHTRLMLHTLSE